MRKIPLVTGEIYHVFNRGVNKGEIFFSESDYRRFFRAAVHYKTKDTKFSYERPFNDPVSLKSLRPVGPPKIQVLAYCLMPNHFHFLLKQLVDGGVTSYFRHLANSYSHYVSVKHKRVGPLFQGRFKNVLIESQEQLLHVSRYIHLNPLITDLVGDLKNYSWSSYRAHIQNYKDELAEPEIILQDFKTKADYERFVLDQEDYTRTLEEIKHLLVDNA